MKKFLKALLISLIILAMIGAAYVILCLVNGKSIAYNDIAWRIRNQFPPKIKIEYVSEIKIDPDKTGPLNQACIITCNPDGEIIGQSLSDSPWISYILGADDKAITRNLHNGHLSKEALESFYGISLGFNTTHQNDSFAIVSFGSAIESIQPMGIYQDTSKNSEEPEGYTTRITFQEGFDGNMMYFYRVNRSDFMFNYGQNIKSLDAACTDAAVLISGH